MPVLSVQGELDPVQPAQAYARDTHHVTGNLRQATIRRSGHFPQEEAPAELVRVLLSFLADVARPPPSDLPFMPSLHASSRAYFA